MTSPYDRLRHWFSHLLGTNEGRVVSWRTGTEGRVMVGFRCHECGKVEGITPVCYREKVGR